MRIKFTNNDLLPKLANHYTTQGSHFGSGSTMCSFHCMTKQLSYFLRVPCLGVVISKLVLIHYNWVVSLILIETSILLLVFRCITGAMVRELHQTILTRCSKSLALCQTRLRFINYYFLDFIFVCIGLDFNLNIFNCQ